MQVQVGNVRLFFDVEGARYVPAGRQMRERPTLLLLHGGPGFDHTSFKPHFSTLTDVAQIVYLDHRANGRSEGGAPDTWNLAQWADDVRAFCDAVGIERPIVYGLSFGGMVAQAYATRHPAHPAKLILDSTAARMRLELAYDMFELLGGRHARAVAEAFWKNPDDTAAFNAYLTVCMPLYVRTPQDPDATSRAIIRRDVLEHYFGSQGEAHRFDFRSQLARVQCPVLVLSGEHDPITPRPLSEELAAAIPTGLVQLARIEGAGHGVFRDRPEEVLALIRRFLT